MVRVIAHLRDVTRHCVRLTYVNNDFTDLFSPSVNGMLSAMMLASSVTSCSCSSMRSGRRSPKQLKKMLMTHRGFVSTYWSDDLAANVAMVVLSYSSTVNLYQ